MTDQEYYKETLQEFIILCETEGWGKVIRDLKTLQPEGYNVLKHELSKKEKPVARLLQPPL